MLRSIDYEGEPICKESTFTLILKMYLHDLLAIEATVNRHESLGRPDFAFNYENFSVIIENKFVHKDTLEKLNHILDEALEKIKKRDYGNNLQNQTRLWRIALVYSQEKKAIVRFACLKD